jgi:hypothetical protein
MTKQKWTHITEPVAKDYAYWIAKAVSLKEVGNDDMAFVAYAFIAGGANEYMDEVRKWINEDVESGFEFDGIFDYDSAVDEFMTDDKFAKAREFLAEVIKEVKDE